MDLPLFTAFLCTFAAGLNLGAAVTAWQGKRAFVDRIVIAVLLCCLAVVIMLARAAD